MRARTSFTDAARRAAAVTALAAMVLAGCSETTESTADDVTVESPAPVTTATPPSSATTTTTTTTTLQPTTTTTTTTSTTTTSTTSTTTSSTTTTLPTTTPYRVPIEDVGSAGWGDTHHDYPATDIFAGCGAPVVSPVNGTLLEVRRENAYDPAVDNPATRGGRSITIRGDDGVRYYLAHFETITDGLEPGGRIELGSSLGTMGQTGRASGCHTHFAISPPCPGKEWSVRRGVVWPYPYLNAWRDGEQRSPVDEVAAWAAANPNACAEAMADPYAADS